MAAFYSIRRYCQYPSPRRRSCQRRSTRHNHMRSPQIVITGRQANQRCHIKPYIHQNTTLCGGKRRKSATLSGLREFDHWLKIKNPAHPRCDARRKWIGAANGIAIDHRRWWRPGRRLSPPPIFHHTIFIIHNDSVTFEAQANGPVPAGWRRGIREVNGIYTRTSPPDRDPSGLTSASTCTNRSSRWSALRGLALLPWALQHRQMQTASAAPLARAFSAASPRRYYRGRYRE
jgi:hypothetical protein